MVLVTGGTGLVGSHLLYFLLKKEEHVRAIHRKNSNLEGVKRIFSAYTSSAEAYFNKVEWVEADILDIPALSKAFLGIEKVYHCAALINFEAKNYKLLKKVNIEGTANVINLSLSNKIEKFCYVSSVAVFGNALNNELITEETAWNPEDDNSVYAITKFGAEMEVWRGAQEGLKTVIVNPGLILGSAPNGDGSSFIVSIGASGIPYYPSGGMGVVDVEDVAKAMILLMNSTIENRQYILVGNNILYKELISKLAQRFHKKPPTKKLSSNVMLFLSALEWFFARIFGWSQKLQNHNVKSMFKKSFYDASRIQKDLDFKFTHIDETLDRIAKFHSENTSEN
ncbi:NAD-dependent epimerase/dehydratase family protein [Aequorivita echinoideorum]|uniref:NAD-dependent epimerase/dehydratase family protein n=1 Tax=Aequorivita echinoideorum TaxID=1549647 RepID=A0ABS5S0X6_9FLAO|nr:NAD-dependent epimerase/dehydratase family protein [Aequorivita echinoideorum]MBT0606859.1 NAD-dependent epimerase/dehydratase family protein [Aequorivita echinoideorum]